MRIETQAIVCAARPHGENGTVVRALTAEAGLLAGYVRGGQSRRLRPVLLPGNVIRGDWRARSDEQLPALTTELVESRATLLGEPLAAIALDWVTALTAAALPEALAYRRLHAALDGLLTAMTLAPAARGWAGALVRYELLMLAELGFGLDLSGCAMGGTGLLAYVSPKSGAAVDHAAGQPFAARLLRLPPFLIAGGEGSAADHLDGLALTGHFLARDLLHGRAAWALAARERLVERFKRMA